MVSDLMLVALSAHGAIASASPVPGLFIRLDLKPLQQIVEAAEEIDHRHQLNDSLIVQTQLPHRGSVHGDSVFTPDDR